MSNAHKMLFQFFNLAKLLWCTLQWNKYLYRGRSYLLRCLSFAPI